MDFACAGVSSTSGLAGAVVTDAGSNVVPVSAAVRRGEWRVRGQSSTFELGGRKVLILGFGRIGTRTARRCAAFDMNVLVFDPYIDQGAISAAGHTPVADLDAALGGVDFL